MDPSRVIWDFIRKDIMNRIIIGSNAAKRKLVTGGLSKPSKMPGYAYNLPTHACIVGTKLRAVPGSTCFDCYAHERGRYRFSNVKEALNRRLASINRPAWARTMAADINARKSRWFRWHDSGDIQSMKHLENIFQVCKRTSKTRHWMPTREAQFLKQVDPATIPSNLIIRMSSHMIDSGPVKFWPWTSTVTSQAGRTCPAPDQGNECGSCRQCWDRSTPNVCYGKH